MNSNIFVCQLPEKSQNKLKRMIKEHFLQEGYSAADIKKIIESVMENRLWNVEEIIDINELI